MVIDRSERELIDLLSTLWKAVQELPLGPDRDTAFRELALIQSRVLDKLEHVVNERRPT